MDGMLSAGEGPRLRNTLGRIGRAVAALIVALAAVVLFGYGWLVWRGSAFEATGDELYDTWARAVVGRQSWLLFTGGGHHPTFLPDEQLAGWEQRFGEDPRYWELRYWNALQREGSGIHPRLVVNGSGIWNSREEAQPLLELAVERAPQDADLAWFALQAQRVEWRWQEYEDEERLNKLPAAQRGAEQARLNEERETAERRLLTELAVAEPQNAFGHYMLAQHCFYLGEEVTGQGVLDAGNEALYCRVPSLFPVSFVRERIRAEQGLGSAAVAGAVSETAEGMAMPNYIKLREIGKEALVMLALSGDTAQLDGVHEMFCRIGAAENATSTVQLFAANSLEEFTTQFEGEYESELNADGHTRLALVHLLNAQVEKAEDARAEGGWDNDPELTTLYSVMQEFPDIEREVEGLQMEALRLIPVLRYPRYVHHVHPSLSMTAKWRERFESLRTLSYGELTGPAV
jgi:hypothetical protein